MASSESGELSSSLDVQEKGNSNTSNNQNGPPPVDSNEATQSQVAKSSHVEELGDGHAERGDHSMEGNGLAWEDNLAVGWTSASEKELKRLFMSYLDQIFRTGIANIVLHGVPEEDAKEAILRLGIHYGTGVTISDLVDSALRHLVDGKHVESKKEPWIQNLLQLESFVLEKLVSATMNRNPFYSFADALWDLLIQEDRDMSVADMLKWIQEIPLTLMAASLGEHKFSVSQSKEGSKSGKHPMHVRSDDRRQSRNSLLELTKEKPSCSTSVSLSYMPGMSVNPIKSRKVSPKRGLNHVQHTSKSKGYRNTNRTIDLHSPPPDGISDAVSELIRKNASKVPIKKTKTSGRGVTKAEANRKAPSAEGSTAPSSSSMTTNNPPPLPETSKELKSTSIEFPISSTSVPSPHGHTVLTKDEISGESKPRDEMDGMVLDLINRVKVLNLVLEEWKNWAQEKVKEATVRLKKDKAKLQSLKLEKEDSSYAMQEKLFLEESANNKFTAMESALSRAKDLFGKAKNIEHRLVAENARLKLELEAAKSQADRSAADFELVSRREEKLKISETLNKEKAELQEVLEAEKRNLLQLQKEIEKAKTHQEQYEARWRREKKLKEEILTQVELERVQREQTEASAKRKEDTTKSDAEKGLQKYKDDIKLLQTQLWSASQSSNDANNATRGRCIDGSHPSNLTQTNETDWIDSTAFFKAMVDLYRNADLPRERECVMCLAEEVSVVFLPCAHQPLCKACNKAHKKEGKTECPSCRAPIKRRVAIRFAD